MTLYVMVGAVIVVALGVVAFLLFLLKKEEKREDQEAKPILDLAEFKKDLPQDALQLPQEPVYKAAASPAMPQVSLAEETYRKRVVELEEELRAVSDKALAQAQEALSMLDQVKNKNEELEEQKRVISAEYEAKLGEAGEHLTRLGQDKSALQNQVDASHAKIVALEDEIGFVKKQMETEIARFNAQVEEMNREKNEAIAEAVNFQVASLKTQFEQLQQANADLLKNHEELKLLNASMLEKNELLQYELTKNRAQVSGLERVCANYKVQMEELLARIESGALS